MKAEPMQAAGRAPVLAFANPRAQYESHKAQIDAAIRAVLERGTYIQGEAHAEFERRFAEYIGTRHAAGVASGTDALVLALRAAGVGPGGKVIVPSHTAAPTISAIRLAGAAPLFVDVDARTYVIQTETVEAVLKDRTRGAAVQAVIAVHLYGQVADVIAMRALADARGVALIEDCAQAAGASIHGKRVGSIGHAGCFSFFPTKNLGAIGDGGAVVTQDEGFANRVRRLRTYGWSSERICLEDGVNSRLDELQAAILLAKLPHLDADNDRRRVIAARYRRKLVGLPLTLPEDIPGGRHVYHLFVAATERRDALLAALKGRNVAAGIHYPVPTHQQPAFTRFAETPLPSTEGIVSRILSLPMYPELSDGEVDEVSRVVREFLTAKSGGSRS